MQWKQQTHVYELCDYPEIYINRDPIDGEYYLFFKGYFISSSYSLDEAKRRGVELYNNTVAK